MANIQPIASFILQWEGTKFTDDPDDHGGATKDGVTLTTWKSMGYDKDSDGDIDVEDLKAIDFDDFMLIVDKHSFHPCKGTLINDQSVAEQLVDFHWCSGTIAIKKLQKIVGATSDGIIGADTLKRINSYSNQEELFNQFKNERKLFLQRIVDNNLTQVKFLQGWLNRVNSLTYRKS